MLPRGSCRGHQSPITHLNKLILKPGREKSLKRRHPWVFSGAVGKVQGNPESGETVECVRHRVSSWPLPPTARTRRSSRACGTGRSDRSTRAFFDERIAGAVAERRGFRHEDVTDAMRLVHGESDGLPGIIADRYGDVVAVQLLSGGRRALARGDRRCPGGCDRSGARMGALGCRRAAARRTAARRGCAARPGEPARVTITEGGLRFEIDFAHGHKTGFYLDQRDNRRRTRELAAGRDVLDGFCYTGGFALNALAGGARSLLAIDSSAEALRLARANAQANDLPPADWIEGDVFRELRSLRDANRRFDLIVLDPPKFAPTAAHAEKAARAYKDINLLAFKLLRPAGLLVTFSCSGGVSADLFQKIVAGAALDAGVWAQIVERLGPGTDHPVALNFPEGDYLKGLVCRVGR